MVDFVIRVIINAIISYIIAAIVYSISVSIANSARKAMQNSLKKKLVELGIDPDNPNEEQLKQFINVDVQKVRGQYMVIFEENIYGIFATSFVTNNKDTAVSDLGQRMMNFVSTNADALTDDQISFFMNVWFDTNVKPKYESKIRTLEGNINSTKYDMNYQVNSLKRFEAKIAKLKLKGKVHKIQPLEIKVNEYKKEKATSELKIESYTEEINKLKQSLETPEFVVNSDFIGERNSLVPLKAKAKSKIIR